MGGGVTSGGGVAVGVFAADGGTPGVDRGAGAGGAEAQPATSITIPRT
jgi:hypothetical protein